MIYDGKHEFIYLSLLIPNPLLQDVWTASYKRVSTQLGDRAVLPAHPIELKSRKMRKTRGKKATNRDDPSQPLTHPPENADSGPYRDMVHKVQRMRSTREGSPLARGAFRN